MTDRKFPTGKVMGFDLSSGPDHSAAATFRVKGGEWTLEDLERISPHATRLSEEFMRREAEARFDWRAIADRLAAELREIAD